MTQLSAVLTSALLLLQTNAPLSPAWQHWRWSRPVEMSPAQEPGIEKVTLPLAVYGNTTDDLHDFRVIDNLNSEVPYLVDARFGYEHQEWLSVSVREVGRVPGQYWQILADLGPDRTRHNQVLLLEEHPTPNFVARVEVAVSDNNKEWRILSGGEAIFRFPEKGENLKVSYSDTAARYLRLRIRDEKGGVPEVFNPSGVQVGVYVKELPEYVQVPISATTRPNGPKAESWWQFDLEVAKVPLSEMRFETRTRDFFRNVRIFASDDGKTWRQAGSDNIAGSSSSTAVQNRTKLNVNFGETRGRYWRVIIENENSPPLDDVQISLWMVPRHIVFPGEHGRTYRLIYGNEFSKPATYDLNRTLNRDGIVRANESRLGDELSNTGWKDPRPWSEQNPYLLWVGLLAAVGVLAWLSKRALHGKTAVMV